jgi:hypothetical protein
VADWQNSTENGTLLTDDIVTTNDNISQMSSNADDIVAHLRSVDVERVSTHYHDCWKSHTVCAMRYAADEIERLRAAGDALAERLRWWTDVAREAAAAVVLQTWEEARRDR